VGGTEFADSSNPSLYWSSSNGTGLSSALRYIPEGGWNEPLDSSSQPQVASSGGGVSKVIPTPGWQAGVGVPSARSGRYTPDVAFSASLHDGYFACFAAAGETCALSGSSYGFEYFAGTSAAAPSMAGVAALLNQKRGAAQGNLNPTLYATFAASPALFHDVTVSTSGVSSCSVSTPSMCNNSIPSAAALSGGQAGFLVGTGYDEVTGLGSLDVGAFLGGSSTTITPTVTVTPSATTIATSQAITVAVVVTAGSSNPTPTGLVSLTGGGYTSSPTTLSAGAANFSIPAGALNGGTDALTAVYTPDSASAKTYSGADGSATVTVTAPPPFLITGSSLTVTPGATSGNTATITITPSGGFTGTVYLSANLTSFPAGVTTLPLISLGSTTPVTITGTSAVTATLTVTTSAASAGGCTAANQGPPTAPWVPGSAVLAGLLLLGVPVRRRGWRALVGMLVLLAALATGATACNTSQTTSNCSSSGSNGAATSAGTYTVTINGASGVTFESGTINLTVQ